MLNSSSAQQPGSSRVPGHSGTELSATLRRRFQKGLLRPCAWSHTHTDTASADNVSSSPAPQPGGHRASYAHPQQSLPCPRRTHGGRRARRCPRGSRAAVNPNRATGRGRGPPAAWGGAGASSLLGQFLRAAGPLPTKPIQDPGSPPTNP